MTILKNPELLKGLQLRVSHPRLADPAPNSHEMADAYLAAFRSPDHAWLRPWRFIECRGDERLTLGGLLADGMAKEATIIDDAAIDKVRQGPLRAPLVIVCYAKLSEQAKVPQIEQKLAVGCAVNNLTTALYALGYGAVWRTGDAAYSQHVHQAVKLEQDEVIIGFLYVGTPAGDDKAIPEFDQSEYVTNLSDHLTRSFKG